VGLQGDDGGVDDVAGPREESDVVLKPLLIEEVLVNRVAVLISVVGTAVLFTAISTLFSFLYNLAAQIMGGLEVTLAED
jgi:hypothetical protein